MKKIPVILLAVSILAASCRNRPVLLPETAFNAVVDGDTVSLYTISGGDLTLQATNFGCRVISLWAPDRNGELADVEIGYDNIGLYLENPGERFLGANVGPVANRIGGASFNLNENEYQLSVNDHGNTLHGGLKGLDMLVWKVTAQTDSSITMEVLHPDGMDGFPGNTTVRLTYVLTDKNEFILEYEAESDADTPVSLAHHSLFNLTGCADKSILDHEITINAGATTPVDDKLIPTGELLSVEGTPFDFREAHKIGERISDEDTQLGFGNGYDHNWVIDRKGDGIEFDVRVYEPESGRVMEVWSDQPGLQFYSGNFFDGTTTDKFGRSIGYRCAFALEPQKFPDALHNDNFPDIVLKAGETYRQTSIYKFSIQ